MNLLTRNLSTEYHLELMIPERVRKAERLLVAFVERMGFFESTDGAGSLTSHYDHPRHMGSNSACKNWFEFDATIRRLSDGLCDRISGSIRYDMKRDQFDIRNSVRVITPEIERSESICRAQADKIIRDISSDFGAAIDRRYACPWCGNRLNLSTGSISTERKTYEIQSVSCSNGHINWDSDTGDWGMIPGWSIVPDLAK